MTIARRMMIGILTICLLLYAVALGEEECFSLRNGIQFGMTQDEVMEVEKQNGLDGDGKKYEQINIAGFDGGEIYYSFHNSLIDAYEKASYDAFLEGKDPDDIDIDSLELDEDEGKLEEISYSWNDFWVLPARAENYKPATFDIKDLEKVIQKNKEIYETLLEALSNKYEIIGGMEGNDRLSFVEFGSSSIIPFSFDNSSSTKYYKYGLTQFLAEDGDDYVEIICKFYRTDSIIDMGLLGSTDPERISIDVEVIYRSISKETMEEVIGSAKDIQEKRDADL